MAHLVLPPSFPKAHRFLTDESTNSSVRAITATSSGSAKKKKIYEKKFDLRQLEKSSKSSAPTNSNLL